MLQQLLSFARHTNPVAPAECFALLCCILRNVFSSMRPVLGGKAEMLRTAFTCNALAYMVCRSPYIFDWTDPTIHVVTEEEPAPVREYKRTHRAARKNWEIPAGWPNPAVEEAYVKPRVDDCRTRFTYGRPDVELLQRFCWDKFGWPHVRTRRL